MLIGDQFTYTGNFQEDLFEGFGTIAYADGKMYEGEFHDN